MKIKVALILAIISLIMGCKEEKGESFARQEKILELSGNPTTGYTWTYEISDNSIVSIEKTIQYLGAENMGGAPSRFIYKITSEKPGNATIKFEYKRQWENVPPLKLRLYDAVVESDGKITLEEKTVENAD